MRGHGWYILLEEMVKRDFSKNEINFAKVCYDTGIKDNHIEVMKDLKKLEKPL